MGFMEKLKNIFFEEEEDEEEIEETRPPKKEKTKKEEKIAKKVEVSPIKQEEPKQEKVEEPKKEELPKEEPKKQEIKKVNTELIFDDDDFIFDTKKQKVEEPPKKTPPISKKVEPTTFKTREVRVEEKKKTFEPPKETYSYTKKVETKTKTFTPSPIISPIYGILDKNYKKEEVKENKEIRLTSRPSRVDFDSVRNKAFGDLEYDLFEDTKEETKVVEPKDIELEEEKREKNKERIKKIYTNEEEDSKPSIDRVTLGEADEYYNDLGLAYNTDYKDLSKDQSDGKMEEKKSEKNLEDNLFDLIESMYDREE